MRQIIQSLSNGETKLVDVPIPNLAPGNLLIQTTISLISAGTEQMLVDFGRSSYLTKALKQPEKVKDVINKAKNDGLLETYEAVQNRLNDPVPMGYCNVGKVLEVGSDITGFRVGDRVISNGNHAEVVSVPRNLCAQIPQSVSDEQASFTILAAIGLQGIRLTEPTLGEYVVVFGLGTIGLMTVQMLCAQGCNVLALDPLDERLKLAEKFGAQVLSPESQKKTLAQAKIFSRGRGVDAVIITASTKSKSIVSQSAKMCRKRGRITLVGVVGLNFLRSDFYEKELSFQVSCSYGPGRYDASYEEQGYDYPVGFVRWTAQRNFEAVLNLMESKKINVESIVSHQVQFEDIPEIYKKISNGEKTLGVIIRYPTSVSKKIEKTIQLPEPSNFIDQKSSLAKVSFIGAGNYASRTLIPAFKASGVHLHSIVNLGGVKGTVQGLRYGFKYSSTDVDAAINNKSIDTVVIATRHDSHADLVCRSLKARKNVFVEKPLAIDFKGLYEIQELYLKQHQTKGKDFKPHLMVGFNRRFSPHILRMKALLSKTKEPKSFIMTMNVGVIHDNHWVHDSLVGGGRILGEACHYIDLMRFLVGFEIVNVNARCFGNTVVGKQNDDNAMISLGFADGSFGTINYLSNGPSSYPKENIQVFCGGAMLELKNFRTLKGYGWKDFNFFTTWRQDKGHKKCIEAFLSGIRLKKSAIPIKELFEVAKISIDIASILRKQI